ncbi:MAG: hypothetical protein K1W40_11345 [Schaedlerella sp.]|uniref:hypothetical protein n=1 Tax=Schaedlerella sp. TaxID=2676057 RepID=UPI0026235C43|nr:hypothetical protein [uncultured Schaedlerella sp.]
MSENEYRQVCMDVEGIKVILEFPAEQRSVQEGERSGIQPGDEEQLRQEIREILTSVLLEKMNL